MASKLQDLYEAKLASSGLTPQDGKRLHLVPLDGPKTQALHSSFKPLCSLKIEYMSHTGEPITDWPGGKPFYRLRYLERPAGFDQMTDKKEVRYVQEPNTAPVAYYPATVNWKTLVEDVDRPIILTEGELKAAKASKEGFPTVGLGGVYNWRSNKLGLEWLPSLEPINWARRNVYICFDSDYVTNPLVCLALHDLSEELARRGAFSHIVSLPSLEGFKKVGLDDFLTFAGPSANDMFAKLLHDAEPLGLTKPLWSLNKRYVYVQDPGMVVDQVTGFKASPSAFKDHLQAPVTYQERKLTKDGSVSYNPVSAAAYWLKWPLRTEAHKITYKPGAEKFVHGKLDMFNTWPGWGAEPKAGSIDPFTKLIDHLFTGSEPEAKRWFLRWCAYPLQYPGVKMYSSVLFHGVRHGTGKSLVGYTLGRIYGENFTEIDQADLHGSFNEWAEGKQFIMGDDITGSDKRQDNDFLKKLITQQKIRVNKKYIPTYEIPDCINYFFTANHPDSFFLEDDDRRHFVHEIQVGPLSELFYVEYDLWLDSGGAAAVFHHLLQLDLGDFNPAAPAFRTLAKDRMTTIVRSDLASWVRDLMGNPDHVLKVGNVKIQKDLFTSSELLALYDPEGKGRTTANGLSRELARAGLHQVSGGRPVRLGDGSQGRYYAVRQPDKWLNASLQEVVKHLDGWNNRQKTSKKY
jgi:hypothetical protein